MLHPRLSHLRRRPAAVGRSRATCAPASSGTPLSGRVRAKTGSITGVNTLSGYIERPDGKTLTFSVQANHHALPSRADPGGDRQRGGGDGAGEVRRVGGLGNGKGEETFDVAPLPFHFSLFTLRGLPCFSSSTATPTPGSAIPPSGPTTRERPLTDKGRKVQSEGRPVAAQERPRADAGAHQSVGPRGADRRDHRWKALGVASPPVHCDAPGRGSRPDPPGRTTSGEQPGNAIVAMVGHSPWMEELAAILLGGSAPAACSMDFPKSGVMGLELGRELEPGRGGAAGSSCGRRWCEKRERSTAKRGTNPSTVHRSRFFSRPSARRSPCSSSAPGSPWPWD